MTKMTEGSKTKTAADDLHPQDDSVGALLRAARQARNLSIEEVSAALRIRHVQLRAIEENNLDELPGITYAVGFVRGYANYLGLNGAEIVDKFKTEHGYAPSQSKLSFPEPVSEGRVPDPIMIGVGFFLAVLVLVFWTVYSNVNSGSGKDAEQIPPAPVVAAASDSSAEAPPAEAGDSPPAPQIDPAAVLGPVAAPAPAPAPAPETAALTPSPAPPDSSSQPQDMSAGAKTPDETQAPEKAAAADANKEAPKPDEPQIKIKRGKSRVTIEASESSWVEISNADGEVIYKKVMRPGDQYFVPDEPGLKLVTSNAGGLEISVDGKSVDSIGGSGEIVRGVSLNPASLKKKKYMFRN
ncbi:MAG: helix-turn-helix domain-containing protein [Alphaproteobacteria bacterium]|nr:helix-turn-helix domain-containing protein [Alphaproteobacteria bacterium]